MKSTFGAAHKRSVPHTCMLGWCRMSNCTGNPWYAEKIIQEELDTLRTLALSVKLLEDAKVTGRQLTPLPVSLSEYIEAYEGEFGELLPDSEGKMV